MKAMVVETKNAVRRTKRSVHHGSRPKPMVFVEHSGWLPFGWTRRLGISTNTKGEIIIKPRFKYARAFAEGLAAVETENGWINKTGAFVITPQYTLARSFRNGRATVYPAHDWRYQVIDTA